MKKLLKDINFRHYISIVITIGFLCCSVFLFDFAFFRLLEAFKDFGLSIVGYFCGWLGIKTNFVQSVNQVSNVMVNVGDFMPDTWAQLKMVFGHINWNLNAKKILLLVIAFVPVIVLFVVVLKILFSSYIRKHNNDYNIDSMPLQYYKRYMQSIIIHVRDFIYSYISFLRSTPIYLYIWLAIWLFNFNIITIVIEFLAYLFYLINSLDIIHIYIQVYKLALDLYPMFEFLPWWAFVVIGGIIFDSLRKKEALRRLREKEMNNRGFIEINPIVFMNVGTMGKRKTTTLTDMALSQEVMFRDKALELIINNDMKFPKFPWINFEKELQERIANRRIYNLASSKLYVRNVCKMFERLHTDEVFKAAWEKRCSKVFHPYPDFCFAYDYEKYGLFYNDNLRQVYLFDVLETYAQLYFIYVIQSSLVVSNYAIRTDNIKSDIGNFPLWNSDFFNRDTAMLNDNSMNSHVLDFDSIRLGKRVIEQSKTAFEFGVVSITEVGKERGNQLENREKKKSDESANQKNDGFNNWLKLVRHSATVDNYPFVRIIMDEQRPESLGADVRELCNIVNIVSADNKKNALPFFWLEKFIHNLFFSRWIELYKQFRYYRGDNTLFMHVLKSIVSKVHNAYERKVNLYGYNELILSTEEAAGKSGVTSYKYFLMYKKIYSDRFSTDCYSDYFNNRILSCPSGLIDTEEYISSKASLDELRGQNSYFINDLLSGFNRDDEADERSIDEKLTKKALEVAENELKKKALEAAEKMIADKSFILRIEEIEKINKLADKIIKYNFWEDS